MLTLIFRAAFGSIFSSLASLLTVVSVASFVALGSYWWGRYDCYQLYKVAELKAQIWQLEFDRDLIAATAKATEIQAQEQAAIEEHNARVDETVEKQVAASSNPPSCASAHFLRSLRTIK